MDLLQNTDEEIVFLVKRGDKKAFEAIVDRYLDKMKRYARKFFFNSSDIDDLVQEVFLKVYVNINSFDENRKFSPWIYRIAHNEFVNAIKKKVHEKFFRIDLDIFFPHPEAKENLEKDADYFFTQKILDKYLKEINVKYREVLILHFFEDMNYTEIAEILEIPISTVGVRLSRAKEKIKKLIGEKEL